MQATSRVFSFLVITFLLVAVPSQGKGQEDSPATLAKHDFVPGEQVLYFEDFSGTSASAVMRRLSQATPRLSIEPREGIPFLHVRPPAGYVAVLSDTLPERFTVDFDMSVTGDNTNGVRMTVVDGGVADPTAFECSQHTVAVANSGGDGRSVEVDRISELEGLGERTFHCSLTVDGGRARAYVDRVQVLDIPRSTFSRSNRIHIEVLGGDDLTLIDSNAPVWLTNVRIAAGGNPLSYDELIKTGRLATRGILFAIGSDRIRPESTPILREIGDMLKAHPDLKLSIEGHTDNVGVPSDNQSLSERRAAAVTAWLTSNYAIDASRLASSGFGSTKPVAPNFTAIGRLQNRRVELVKQ